MRIHYRRVTILCDDLDCDAVLVTEPPSARPHNTPKRLRPRFDAYWRQLEDETGWLLDEDRQYCPDHGPD